MTTRLLHVSDTHLGNRQYGSDVRRADFAAAFDSAVVRAVEEDVDAVIHTGDLFDTRDPGLPDLNRCIDILERLRDADIPFYGIVGNHERKMDDQYLDLIEKTGTAERLTHSPTVINDEVAIYGIDAVTKPAWHAKDFTLEEPPDGVFTVLCMHQLLHPPVPEFLADHPLKDVLDRVNIDLDALALGDYHESAETVARGKQIWYPGSTERCAIDETATRCVSLVTVDEEGLTRRELELETRPFLQVDIEFADGDGYAYVESVIDRYDVDEKVINVTVTGEASTITAQDVREIVMNSGAAVCRVDDQRGGPDLDLSDGPEGDVQSADRLIEEKLAERNLSSVAIEIEERVRTTGVTPSGFDDEIEELVLEAQSDVFDADADSSENRGEGA